MSDNVEQQCAVLDLVVAELRGGDRRNEQADIVESVVCALRGDPPNRPNDDGAVDAMLAALSAGGVSCGEDAAYDWVDDLASTIRDALLAAGWTEPNNAGRESGTTTDEGEAIESFHRVLHDCPGAGMHGEGEISHGCGDGGGGWIDDYGWDRIPVALLAAGWTPPITFRDTPMNS